MARSRIPFHIQHSVKPAHIERILMAVSHREPFGAESLHLLLTRDGYDITRSDVSRNLDMGKKLGLFEKTDRFEYRLSVRGQDCRNLALYRREVYGEMMHFLLFATWEIGGHRDYWSWSYSKICEILWRDRPTITKHKTIFGQLSAEASQEFPDMAPVVGTETVYTVTNWLQTLSPPFLLEKNGKVTASQERKWFSAELALLAVSYLYSIRGAAAQTPVLLDQPTVESLCPLCLAPVDRIVAMIEMASRTFSFLSIHAGEWGSSVILQTAVDISMLT